MSNLHNFGRNRLAPQAPAAHSVIAYIPRVPLKLMDDAETAAAYCARAVTAHATVPAKSLIPPGESDALLGAEACTIILIFIIQRFHDDAHVLRPALVALRQLVKDKVNLDVVVGLCLASRQVPHCLACLLSAHHSEDEVLQPLLPLLSAVVSNTTVAHNMVEDCPDLLESLVDTLDCPSITRVTRVLVWDLMKAACEMYGSLEESLKHALLRHLRAVVVAPVSAAAASTSGAGVTDKRSTCGAACSSTSEASCEHALIAKVLLCLSKVLGSLESDEFLEIMAEVEPAVHALEHCEAVQVAAVKLIGDIPDSGGFSDTVDALADDQGAIHALVVRFVAIVLGAMQSFLEASPELCRVGLSAILWFQLGYVTANESIWRASKRVLSSVFHTVVLHRCNNHELMSEFCFVLCCACGQAAVAQEEANGLFGWGPLVCQAELDSDVVFGSEDAGSFWDDVCRFLLAVCEKLMRIVTSPDQPAEHVSGALLGLASLIESGRHCEAIVPLLLRWSHCERTLAVIRARGGRDGRDLIHHGLGYVMELLKNSHGDSQLRDRCVCITLQALDAITRDNAVGFPGLTLRCCQLYMVITFAGDAACWRLCEHPGVIPWMISALHTFPECVNTSIAVVSTLRCVADVHHGAEPEVRETLPIDAMRDAARTILSRTSGENCRHHYQCARDATITLRRLAAVE